MKLFYFDMPGRAELARIVLHVGGVEYEDVRFKDKQEWVEVYKPKSPTGQCPFLELDDGTLMCQSSAIAYYVASLSGFLPSDAVGIARVLELMACFDDVRPLSPISNAAEKPLCVIAQLVCFVELKRAQAAVA